MSVKYSLLALLYQRPVHGYELHKQLRLAIGTEAEVKPGQIYQTLRRLKAAGPLDCRVVMVGSAVIGVTQFKVVNPTHARQVRTFPRT